MKLSLLTSALTIATIVCATQLARAADASDPKKPAAGQTEPAKPYKDVDVAQFDKLRTGTNTVVLDVRTEAEFAAGHIPGAININVNSPDFQVKVLGLDKSKTYLVNCAAGLRSAKACGKMAPLKFDSLYNLKGGFTAWEKAGKPVDKK